MKYLILAILTLLMPLSAFAQVRGVSYDNATRNVLQTDLDYTAASVNATVLQQGGVNVVTTARSITIAGTANEITSSAGAQDLSANRTWTLSLPAAMTFTGKTITGGSFVSISLTTPTVLGAITFPDNTRQTFNPGANAAGINVGSLAGDPDTPSNGDLWYNSSLAALRAWINGAAVSLGAGGGGGTGDVTGPSSSTNNNLVRFDGTTGKLIQDGDAIMDDDGNISTPGSVTASGGLIVPGNGAAGTLQLFDDDVSAGITLSSAGTVSSSPNIILPSAPGTTGVLKGTVSGTNVTTSFGALTTADVPAVTREMVFPLTIEDVADNMNFVAGFVRSAFTITEIRAVHSGSGLATPSIQLTVNQGTDRTSGTAVVTGGSTITSTTTGDPITVFNDATCPANSWLWITTASQSGTTDNLEIVIIGTYD